MEGDGNITIQASNLALYADIAVLRWQTLTGKSARLEGDGRTFAEVQAARAAAMRTRRPAENDAEEAACPDRS
jgi:hypothetical protein